EPESRACRVGHTSHGTQVTCGRTGHGGRGPPCEAAAQQMKATGDPACRGIAGGAEGIDEGEAWPVLPTAGFGRLQEYGETGRAESVHALSNQMASDRRSGGGGDGGPGRGPVAGWRPHPAQRL